MGPADRGRRPPPLDYQSRLRWPPAAVRPPRVDVAVATARLAGTTTSVLTAGCLLVAVPCVVFAVVGAWFGDASACESAAVAAVTGAAAAVAAVPALLCHRFCLRHPCRHRPRLGPTWN